MNLRFQFVLIAINLLLYCSAEHILNQMLKQVINNPGKKNNLECFPLPEVKDQTATVKFNHTILLSSTFFSPEYSNSTLIINELGNHASILNPRKDVYYFIIYQRRVVGKLIGETTGPDGKPQSPTLTCDLSEALIGSPSKAATTLSYVCLTMRNQWLIGTKLTRKIRPMDKYVKYDAKNHTCYYSSIAISNVTTKGLRFNYNSMNLVIRHHQYNDSTKRTRVILIKEEPGYFYYFKLIPRKNVGDRRPSTVQLFQNVERDVFNTTTAMDNPHFLFCKSNMLMSEDVIHRNSKFVKKYGRR
jgi:hypothetical protein